ncbi:MAG: diaminopimelate decarboxylase [Rhodothermaeota bacterium MED-G18]|nr:MAG: diaminopimelate decarboxylase [Rhodothermaeota bacterium MED-G18]
MFQSELVKRFINLSTPFYYYDLEILEKNLLNLKNSLKPYNKVHFSVKSNTNPRILSVIKNFNLGIDAVSANEIKHCINLGFTPRDIVFAGVGKSDEEIEYGIINNISYFNVESLQELKVIDSISKKFSKKTTVSIRINPNIKSETHKKIQTGSSDDKFGIDLNDISHIPKLRKLENINITGLHFHIGSQIINLKPFHDLCMISNEILNYLRENDIKIKNINVGGGLGIDYEYPENNLLSNFKEFINLFNNGIRLDKNQSIHFELGRSIVGQCGFLISKILYSKKSYDKNFLILDSGMNNLIRPALYNSKHKISNLTSKNSDHLNYDVAGPICESSDTFAKDYRLVKSIRGDLIAIHSCGAYAESMSSNYNLRDNINSYYSDTI